MSNINVGKIVFTCRDCKDFYDCNHELEHNSIVCEYFVKKYKRTNKVETIGDLMRKCSELKLKRMNLLYNTLLNEWVLE
jgi:hypothetical protein